MKAWESQGRLRSPPLTVMNRARHSEGRWQERGRRGPLCPAVETELSPGSSGGIWTDASPSGEVQENVASGRG